MKVWSVAGVALIAVTGCAPSAPAVPSDESLIATFEANRMVLEQLRTEACRLWWPNGGLLDLRRDTRGFTAEQKRLAGLLEQIGAINVSARYVNDRCALSIRVWDGEIYDSRLRPPLRRAAKGFWFGPTGPQKIADYSDAVTDNKNIGGGWLITQSSWTFTADPIELVD